MVTIVRTQLVSSNSQTTHNISLSVSPAAGNALVFIGQTFGAVTIDSTTDNGGASPSYNLDYTFTGSGGSQGRVFTRTNITDSPSQVSITLSASQSIRGWLVELAGIPNTGYIGTSAQIASPGAFTTNPTVNFTTGTANEAALAFQAVDVTRDSSTPDGYTKLTESVEPTSRWLFHNADLGAEGSKSFVTTLTNTGGTNAYAAVVTFVEATTPSNIITLQFETAEASNYPTITSVVPSTFNNGTENITITGTNFGATQGSSTVDIDGYVQTGLTWSDTEIVIPVVSIGTLSGSATLRVKIG